jgi:hypothetical protein
MRLSEIMDGFVHELTHCIQNFEGQEEGTCKDRLCKEITAYYRGASPSSRLFFDQNATPLFVNAWSSARDHKECEGIADYTAIIAPYSEQGREFKSKCSQFLLQAFHK